MDNTKENFDIRKKEIERYFSFLFIIDNDETLLKGEFTSLANTHCQHSSIQTC